MKMFFVLIMAVLLMFMGCNSDVTDTSEATSQESDNFETDASEQNSSAYAGYTVVYPENGGKIRALAKQLRDAIKTKTGKELPLKSDNIKDGVSPDSVSELEILVGTTNRTASSMRAGAGSGGWWVDTQGKRIVVNAKSIKGLYAAVEYFLNNYTVSGETVTLKKAKTEKLEDELLGSGLTLKVATFNIKNGELVNHDMSKLADIIKPLDLDIVALQEVDINTNRSGKKDTLKLLAEAAGYEYYKFAKAIPHDGGEYGTAIMSRYPITEFEVIQLGPNDTTNERRAIGCATIDINGCLVPFFNTHLALDENEIKYQLNQIFGIVGDMTGYILTADFNTNKSSYFEPFENALRVNPNDIFHTFADQGIDDIILDCTWSVKESEMVPSMGGSDHNLLWVKIKYSDGFSK